MNKQVFVVLAFITNINFSYAQNTDVLNVTSYKLENGFTVFLNEDTTANNIFGAVMVKAGLLMNLLMLQVWLII